MERPVRARRRELRRRRHLVWLVVPGVAWLVVFYLVPMFATMSVSLQQGSLERGYRLTWHWTTYMEALSRYHSQFFRSIVYGLVVTVVCLAIAYPLAYAIAFRAGRSRNALLFMVVLPFFVSLVIRTLSWKFILSDDGFLLGMLKHLGFSASLHVLDTPGAVIGGLVYNYLPFMTLPLYVALERIDPRLFDASADLYGGRWQTFRRVTLPLSMAGVVAGSLLTYVSVAGDYINAELLGGPGQEMVGNVIQRQYLIVNDYPLAAALSFVLVIAVVGMVAAYARFLGTDELVA